MQYTNPSYSQQPGANDNVYESIPYDYPPPPSSPLPAVPVGGATNAQPPPSFTNPNYTEPNTTQPPPSMTNPNYTEVQKADPTYLQLVADGAGNGVPPPAGMDGGYSYATPTQEHSDYTALKRNSANAGGEYTTLTTSTKSPAAPADNNYLMHQAQIHPLILYPGRTLCHPKTHRHSKMHDRCSSSFTG